MIFVIEGSMQSVLCAVFEWFERKPGPVTLQRVHEFQPDAFRETLHIHNDPVKAERVWKGLKGRLPADWIRRFYCTFLSETRESISCLFEFACYVFLHPVGINNNFGNIHVLSVSKTAIKVEREKHRMEAFIRFQHLSDGIFYCGIAPDFNVLPLIITHFRNRYADQKWIIYDIKRNYGVHYDLSKVEEVYLESKGRNHISMQSDSIVSEPEVLYAALWKQYFKSTNIASRKNTDLHVRHVPKRYWKYLTEKHDL